MRIMPYLCSFIFLVSQPILADNPSSHHRYPGTKESTQSLSPSVKEGKPGFYSCDVEVVNDSFSNITVYGRYDDGVPLIPFNVYSYEYSHYVDLFYNGYCHSGVYLSVVTFSGYAIFSGYVFAGSTLHVVPSIAGKMKVEIKKA
jgi:hypothetical protein